MTTPPNECYKFITFYFNLKILPEADFKSTKYYLWVPLFINIF